MVVGMTNMAVMTRRALLGAALLLLPLAGALPAWADALDDALKAGLAVQGGRGSDRFAAVAVICPLQRAPSEVPVPPWLEVIHNDSCSQNPSQSAWIRPGPGFQEGEIRAVVAPLGGRSKGDHPPQLRICDAG